MVVLRKAKSVGSDRGRSSSPQIGMTLTGQRLYLVSLLRLWRARAAGTRIRANSLPALNLEKETQRRVSAPPFTDLL